MGKGGGGGVAKVASLKGRHHVVNFGGTTKIDMMTKPVSLYKFKHCLDLFGICNLNYPFMALLEAAKEFLW